MKKSMPQIFLQSWEEMHGPAVFTTVGSKDDKPNSVYVGCFKLRDDKIIVVNNKFYKTAENIKNEGYGTFLFITQAGISYQVKGLLKNYTEGLIYDDMKQWLNPKYPGYSAVVLSIEEIYSGRDKIL